MNSLYGVIKKTFQKTASGEASSSHSPIKIQIDSRDTSQNPPLENVRETEDCFDNSPIDIVIISRKGKRIRQPELLSAEERGELFKKINEQIIRDVQFIEKITENLEQILENVQDNTERVKKSIKPLTQIRELEQNIEKKVKDFIKINQLRHIDIISLSLNSVPFFKFAYPEFVEDNYDLLKSVSQEAKYFKRNLAKSPELDKFPPEFMFLLAQDEDKNIKIALAKNPMLTSEVIDILLEDKSFDIEVNLAKHPKLEDKHITLLLERDLKRINNLKDNIQDAGMVMINLAENKSIELSDEQKKMFGQVKYDEKFEDDNGNLLLLRRKINKFCPPQSVSSILYKMLQSG